MVEKDLISNYMADNRVEWKFITPRAAWHGGMWERLIGLTKSTFKKVVGNTLLNPKDLETIVIQIEAKLNDRPLTYLSSNVEDFQPLTPPQLILGFKLREFPNEINYEEISDPSFACKPDLSKIFIHRTRVLNKIWKRWKQEYLLSLRERCSTIDKSPSIKEGQVLLIAENCRRNLWKMGIIVELLQSLDEKVRSVKLRTSSGILVRPIAKLYPLELDCVEQKDSKPLHNSIERCKRSAALKALRNMKISY